MKNKKLLRCPRLALGACLLFSMGMGFSQQPQNPSPMVEHTRAHPRLLQKQPPGKRFPLDIGTLYLPERIVHRKKVPLYIHFHGPAWILETAVFQGGKAAAIGIQIGSGSGIYAKSFQDPQRFGRLVQQAEKLSGITFSPIGLTAWSAGHGSIREILKTPAYFQQIDRVLLIDGLHTGYVGGKPGPLESNLEPDSLDIFLRFAREAIARRKQMIITHSEIFPGTFASTTETTDFLLARLGLSRRAVLRWGPMKTQQLSEVEAGWFHLIGYAGNSAPDHVDQLHALPELLKLFRR